MKKLVWEVKAFAIWGVNGICSIVIGPFKTYFASIMMFLIIIAMSSCSVMKTSHRPCKPLNKALTLNKTRQKVERMTNPDRQFIVINNELIMFENNN